MRIASIHHEERATRTLALVCGGGCYEVAAVEGALAQEVDPWLASLDFHGRVFGARGAGLDALYDALLRQNVPASRALDPASFVYAPPLDPDRARVIVHAPYAHGASTPVSIDRDARAAVGAGQPVAFPADAEGAYVEPSVAAVIGEELWRATPREAMHATLGLTLVLDWTMHPERWTAPTWAHDAPVQVGPVILTEAIPRLEERAVRLRVGEEVHALGRVGDWRFHMTELLAFVSQHRRLLPGDVVACGNPAPSPIAVPWSAAVRFELDGLLRLDGRPRRGPAPGPWRR